MRKILVIISFVFLIIGQSYLSENSDVLIGEEDDLIELHSDVLISEEDDLIKFHSDVLVS